jgi:hypothetical protein
VLGWKIWPIKVASERLKVGRIKRKRQEPHQPVLPPTGDCPDILGGRYASITPEWILKLDKCKVEKGVLQSG